MWSHSGGPIDFSGPFTAWHRAYDWWNSHIICLCHCALMWNSGRKQVAQIHLWAWESHPWWLSSVVQRLSGMSFTALFQVWRLPQAMLPQSTTLAAHRPVYSRCDGKLSVALISVVVSIHQRKSSFYGRLYYSYFSMMGLGSAEDGWHLLPMVGWKASSGLRVVLKPFKKWIR